MGCTKRDPGLLGGDRAFEPLLRKIAASTLAAATLPEVLARRRGLVRGEQAMASVSEDGRHLLGKGSWSWTTPTMSIVLSRREVSCLIENRDRSSYQPFDPSKKDALPKSGRFDLGPYRETLREGIPSGQSRSER